MPLLKTSLIRKSILFLVAAMLSVSAIAADFNENQRLANQGNASAQYNLGIMYYKGERAQKDKSKAIEWFRKAANQGHIKSKHNLEVIYGNDEGVYQDKLELQQKSKSVPVFSRSSADMSEIDRVYAEADRLVAAMTEAERAEHYAKSRADLAELSASIASGKTPENPLERLAKQGDADAQYVMGVGYFNGYGNAKDYKKAFEWYQKAANQGLAKAQFELGGMYFNGYGITKNYEKGMEWWEKAANQGNANAQYNLGVTYQKGYGVYGTGKDYKKAFELYKNAAKQGLSESQNNLGFMYDKGLGVRQDYKKAFEWYQESANQGNVDAQNNLGRAYLKGEGVRQNKAKAKEIFGQTCDAGNQVGCDNYRLLNQK